MSGRDRKVICKNKILIMQLCRQLRTMFDIQILINTALKIDNHVLRIIDLTRLQIKCVAMGDLLYNCVGCVSSPMKV